MPPIEITGTALILIVCNVFRNMPVGVRAGMAAMSQIDRSLDEASTTLGARGFTTLRTVLLPLLKPAIVAALVYSFVRAVTTLSAVIFLVSAQYEWATTYIINRVVNGDYGVAIAYSSVLIVLMLAVIWLIQRLVGERRLGRRARGRAGAASASSAAAPRSMRRSATDEGRFDRVPGRHQALRRRRRRQRRLVRDRRRARSSRCSAPPAAARRRSCACSRGSSFRRRERS